MEVADYPLSGLELLPIGLLFLEHLFLILHPLILQVLLPFLHHIINILGLLIHCPPIINLRRLKPILIIIHHNINLPILLYLHAHLLNLINHRTF